MSDDMKVAKCKDCGDRKEVYCDTGLCESCENEYIYCRLCNKRHHEDDTCRHLFWDEMVAWWAGPGADESNKIEEYQEAVKFALKQLNPEVLEDLRICLQNGTLRFCLCGTTFGVDTIEFEGRDDARKGIYRQNIVEHMHGKVYHEWSEQQTHWFEIGFEWLMSLDAKTPRERTLVLQWIEEIQKGDSP